jgi:hypothetical protein
MGHCGSYVNFLDLARLPISMTPNDRVNSFQADEVGMRILSLASKSSANEHAKNSK